MIPRFITLLLLIVAIIHLLPLAGLLGPEQLNKLYGIVVSNPNLDILMRHRAVLFGILGGFLAIAAFRPAWQAAAITAGVISVGSFLWLIVALGDGSSALRQVFIADVIASVCLLSAIVLNRLQARNHRD